jgi:hypothetical protein
LQFSKSNLQKGWQNKQEETLNRMLKQKGTKRVGGSHNTNGEVKKEMLGGMWDLV